MGQKWRVNHPKNVNSTFIRTVFKIKSWNFTWTSTTPRDRLCKGWRFYCFPTGVRNKGLIQKTWIRRAFAQFLRWRVETSQERRRHFGTGRERVDDSTFSPTGVRNKGLITQKTWIRRAFAHFSRWRVETSQERRPTLRDRSWKGWRFYRFPHRGQKWRVNHTKNVNSTCICTFFKMKSWNFTGTSTTLRDRSWRGGRFYVPQRGQK